MRLKGKKLAIFSTAVTLAAMAPAATIMADSSPLLNNSVRVADAIVEIDTNYSESIAKTEKVKDAYIDNNEKKTAAFSDKVTAVGEMNVYEEASATSNIVGKLSDKNIATVASDIVSGDSEWTKISSGELTGYVRTANLCFEEEAEAVALIHGDVKATAKSDNINTFKDASEQEVISTVNSGDTLQVVGSEDDHIIVEGADGKSYIKSSDVDVSAGLETGKTNAQIEAEETKKAEEEAARRAAEEEAERKAAKEEAARRKAEEEKAIKEAQEAAIKKAVEEAERKAAEEAAAKATQEAAEARAASEAAASVTQSVQETAAAKATQAAATTKSQSNDSKANAARQEAATKAAQEAAAARAAQEAAAAKAAQEAAAAKAAQEAAAAKARAVQAKKQETQKASVSSEDTSSWSTGTASAYGGSTDPGCGSITANGSRVTESSMGVAIPLAWGRRDLLGHSVLISYGGKTVTAVINDLGGMGGGSRALDLQPGVFRAFGFNSCNAWGLRTVKYKIL